MPPLPTASTPTPTPTQTQTPQVPPQLASFSNSAYETQASDFGTNVVYSGDDFPRAYMVNVVSRTTLCGITLALINMVHQLPIGAHLNLDVFQALVMGVHAPGVTPKAARGLLFDGRTSAERKRLYRNFISRRAGTLRKKRQRVVPPSEPLPVGVVPTDSKTTSTNVDDDEDYESEYESDSDNSDGDSESDYSDTSASDQQKTRRNMVADGILDVSDYESDVDDTFMRQDDDTRRANLYDELHNDDGSGDDYENGDYDDGEDNEDDNEDDDNDDDDDNDGMDDEMDDPNSFNAQLKKVIDSSTRAIVVEDAADDSNSGKKKPREALCTVNGAVSPQHALLATQLIVMTLCKFGIPCQVANFNVHNIVATLAMNLGSIDPERLKLQLGALINYNPERIDMVRVVNPQLKLVFLVWPSDGRVIVTRAKTIEQISDGVRWIYGCCKRAVSTSGYLTSGDLKRRHRQGPLQRLLTGREDDLTPTNAQDMLRLLGYTVQMHSSARPTKLLTAPDKSTSARRAELALEYNSSDLDDDDVAKGAKGKRACDAEHANGDAYPSRSDLTDSDDDANYMATTLADDDDLKLSQRLLDDVVMLRQQAQERMGLFSLPSPPSPPTHLALPPPPPPSTTKTVKQQRLITNK